MDKSLLSDHRSCDLATVDQGMIRRTAATRLGVVAAAVIGWHESRHGAGACATK